MNQPHTQAFLSILPRVKSLGTQPTQPTVAVDLFQVVNFTGL